MYLHKAEAGLNLQAMLNHHLDSLSSHQLGDNHLVNILRSSNTSLLNKARDEETKVVTTGMGTST
jgi:hypothetical protein